MEERRLFITEELLEGYRSFLLLEEKSPATVGKYMRDLRKLMAFAGTKSLTKELMIRYKQELTLRYKAASVNSCLIAASGFLEHQGRPDLKVHTLKIQRRAFYPEEKCLTRAEFKRLVKRARIEGRERLVMILNTLAATGIRVSELPYITVESLEEGCAVVNLKGKTRIILLSSALVACLREYCAKNGIQKGMIFVTSGGKPVNRSNIWKEMKLMGKRAGIPASKIFPHSIRHLFARNFYEEGKDIAKLADVLGHSSIETTRVYIMTSGKEHRKHLEKMQMIF